MSVGAMNVVPFLVLLVTLVFYAWLGHRSRLTTPDLTQFFMYGRTLETAGFFSTVSSSSISLGAAILAFLSLGYYLPWIALVATATWIIGFWFHYTVMRRVLSITPSLKTGLFTLHGYLGHSYRSDTLMMLASTASIIGFVGAYGVEMVAVTKLISPYLSSPFHQLLIIVVLSVFLGSYVANGGFRSVVVTARWQLWIFIFAMLLCFGYVISKAGSGAEFLDPIAYALTINAASFPLPLLFGLLFINLPWQLIDMSQWQRTLSCQTLHVVRRGLAYSALGIAFSWLLLIGLGLSMHTLPLEENPVATFLTLFSGHPVYYSLLLVAAVAALFSTADAYIIAAVQSYICDVRHPDLLSETASGATPQNASTIMLEARRSIWIISIIAPIIAFGANILIPEILELFFMVFTAQLSLVPSVVFANYLVSLRSTLAALISVAVGLFTAICFFIFNLFYPVENLAFYAPIVTLIVAFVAYISISLPRMGRINFEH